MKVLIVKTSSLGDVVQTFPVISYLRTRYPDCEIHWIAEAVCAVLPEAHPQVDRVLRIDSKKWRRTPLSAATWQEVRAVKKSLHDQHYDLVIDLQGNTKSAILTWLASSPVKVGFDRPHVAEWPNVLATTHRFGVSAGQNIRADYLQVVQQYFNDTTPYTDKGISLKINDSQKKAVIECVHMRCLEGRQKILVCTGSMWRNKRIPTETLLNFLQKVQHRISAGFLFAWGSEDERREAEWLASQLPHSAVIMRLPLPALQNLMDHVDLVIAMDSLPLHLAGTTSTPTFSFFGPSLAAKYSPEGSQHTHFQGTCPYGHTFDKRCPILRTCKTGACLREQTVDILLEHFSCK